MEKTLKPEVKTYTIGMLAPHSKSLDDELFESNTLNSESPAFSTKAKPTSGRNSQAKGGTLLVRFAASLTVKDKNDNPQPAIKHALIDRYHTNGGGINVKNDRNALNEINTLVVKHFLDAGHSGNGLVDAIATALSQYGEPTTDNDLDINLDADLDVGGFDLDAAMSEVEETPSPDKATATERESRILVRSVDDVAHLAALSDDEAQPMIDAAMAVLTKAQSNGSGVRMDINGGRTFIDPPTLAASIKWGEDYWMMGVAFEMIRIAPKRSVNRADHFNPKTGKRYKTRQAFSELVATNDRQRNTNRRNFLKRIAAFVITESGANFYNHRFAYYITDEAAADIRACVRLNEEVASSAVIGGRAGNWLWTYEEANWKTNGSNAEAVSTNGFSLNDL